MKKIQAYVDKIDEELEGAKEYAECYVDFKARGNNQWASRYKDMANDELRHAMTIHERALDEIEQLNQVFTPPMEMQEKWDESHKMYVEKSAWIKTMLSM